MGHSQVLTWPLYQNKRRAVTIPDSYWTFAVGRLSGPLFY